MIAIEAEKFRAAVGRKLAAEGVTIGEHKKAISVLYKCVLGVKLVKAYKKLYMVNA